MTHNKVSYFLFALIGIVSNTSCEKPHDNSKPNIILIFTDDQGYADIGAQGINVDVKTPHIDLLASNGIRFTDGYVTAPQCSPSRAGIMTGRYQQKFGMEDNTTGPIPKEELTIADRLNDAGYVTGMVGKWHLDPNHTSKDWLTINYPTSLKNPNEPIPHDLKYPHSPSGKGFDYYFWGNRHSYFSNFDISGDPLFRPKNITDDRYRIDVQTDAALGFINENYEDSFFLYLSYFGPHVPLEASDKYLNRFDKKGLANRRKFGLAMISSIDDGVGKILSKLEEHNIKENTLIFFISDNGAPLRLSMPDNPITGKSGPDWDGSLNDPWIGEKGMLTEGGIRVPYIMYWEGTLDKGKVIEYPVSTLDVMATAMSVSGQKISKEMDGINLLPYLLDDSLKIPKRSLYWKFWNQAAIRSNEWKYIKLSDGKEYLFNIKSKFHEKRNLINKHPKISKRLNVKLSKWLNTLDKPGLTERPINVSEKNWYKFHFEKYGNKKPTNQGKEEKTVQAQQ